MKSKIEQKLDTEFEKLKVTPRVFHFVKDILPFTALTIADERLTWFGAQSELTIAYSQTSKFFFSYTRLLDTLRKRDIYGVAICDKRDQFNRQRGRIIAKGRLLKHLKELERAKK